jgi:hypothetical protein
VLSFRPLYSLQYIVRHYCICEAHPHRNSRFHRFTFTLRFFPETPPSFVSPSVQDLSGCMQWLDTFQALPHRGLLLPLRPYFDLHIPPNEAYTRQLHHPTALAFSGLNS